MHSALSRGSVPEESMLSATFALLLSMNPALAGSGKIKVNVAGNPGEIILDGFLTGKTAPALLEDVAVGVHHVELNYGCMSGEAEAEVNPGQTTVLNLRMKTFQGTGTLRLRGLPNSGMVFLDGRPIQNPYEGFEAACGGREISVEAPGYEIWSTQVVVTRGKWSTVDVELVEGRLDSTQSVRRRPPPGVAIEDDLADFEDDLQDLDPIEDGLFDDDPPPLDLSTIDGIEGLEDDYDDLDGDTREERNRRRLAEAQARDREGVSEWEPDNPSDRELERARQYEEEQRRKAAGLDDEYFDEEQSRGRALAGAAPLSGVKGKVYLAGTGALLVGGTTLAILSHQKYKSMNTTYELVYPECGVECSPEGVAYYDAYVWPQQQRRAYGLVLGSVGLVGLGAGYFMVGDEPSTSGPSLAQKAAKRQAKADAKAAKAAAKNAVRDSQMYDDLDALDSPSSGSGGNMARLGALAGTGALVGGGLGWGLYEHKQFQQFETTYLTVWPECAVQCTADGVAYYDSYVWPHQRNRF